MHVVAKQTIIFKYTLIAIINLIIDQTNLLEFWCALSARNSRPASVFVCLARSWCYGASYVLLCACYFANPSLRVGVDVLYGMGNIFGSGVHFFMRSLPHTFPLVVLVRLTFIWWRGQTQRGHQERSVEYSMYIFIGLRTHD